MTPRLWEVGWSFIFDYSSLFCFLLIEIYITSSISYMVLTCYVYYYCIVFDNVLKGSSPVLRRISTVLFHRISHGMWLLTWEFLLIKSVLHFAFVHLFSCYYYYDNVVIGIGVLSTLWFTEFLVWIDLPLSKEVKQLKIIIAELHFTQNILGFP